MSFSLSLILAVNRPETLSERAHSDRKVHNFPQSIQVEAGIEHSRGTWLRSWLRHYDTRRKVAGSSSYEMDFSMSSRTMALGSTQPVTEMNTRNLPGGKGRPPPKADNLTAFCEPIV
jgi:hypothetical protein